MQKFAFISRHTPTSDQIRLAQEKGIELIPVGDRDAFTCDFGEFIPAFDGVVVVHAAASLRAARRELEVGIFENGNRAPEGQPPKFEAVALHIYY